MSIVVSEGETGNTLSEIFQTRSALFVKMRSTLLKHAILFCENKAFLRIPVSLDFWSLFYLEAQRKRILWRRGKRSNGTNSTYILFQSIVQWGRQEDRYCQGLGGSCCWWAHSGSQLTEQPERCRPVTKEKLPEKRCPRCEDLEEHPNRTTLVNCLEEQKELQWKRLKVELCLQLKTRYL